MFKSSPGLYVRIDTLNGAAPKLCRNCVHFVPPKAEAKVTPDLKLGKCKYFAEIQLIDGEVGLPFAAVARIHMCKGDMWSPNESI